MQEGAGLHAQGLGHRGMGVAQRGHGQPREEVEVAAARLVEELGPLAPYEGDGLGRVGGHEVAHRLTMVPTPSRVKTSNSRA